MDTGQDRQADPMLDMALGNEQFLKYAEDLVTAHRSEKQKRKELGAAYEMLHAIIDSISEGVVATDERLIVIEANQSLCRLLEIQREEMLQRSLPDLIDPAEVQERFIDLVRATGGRGRFEIEMVSPKRRILGVSAARLKNMQGYVMVFSDITAAKRAEKMKQEFFSILSHELKTPLNGIIGLSDLLAEDLKGKIDEEQFSYIQDIITCGNRMTSTVTELLDFAELQNRGLEEMNEKLSLKDVIEGALLGVREIGQEKNIVLRTMDGPCPVSVTGNALMLKELFFHILENAVVFGRQDGEVTITLNENDKSCEVTISDDGIGIPSSELERVFDSFYQVEEHSTRSQDGLGLGLSLAKRIAELHGGCIHLESTLGKGTKCRVTLPHQRGS